MAKKKSGSGKPAKQIRKPGSKNKTGSTTVYKRNYLTQVIARLDFSTAHSLLQGGPAKSVVKALKPHFPLIEQKKQFQLLQVQVSKPDSSKMPKEMVKDNKQSRTEVYQWFFHNKERTKSFHIATDCCYIEFKKYSRFGELRQDFLEIVQALFDSLPSLQASRFGLRYIDTIVMQEDNPTDWSKYLKPHLLGIFKNATDPATITRALSLLDFDYGDMQMRFQYGMSNPDFPAPIRQKQFTLDYDAYCTGLLDYAEIEKYLDRFHEKIKASFEEVITDGLRAKMNSDA